MWGHSSVDTRLDPVEARMPRGALLRPQKVPQPCTQGGKEPHRGDQSGPHLGLGLNFKSNWAFAQFFFF